MFLIIFEFLLSFILEQEEAYVEFLRVRRVPLEEREGSDDVCDIIPQVICELMFES